MKRSDPCNHLRPDYSRLEDAFYITRDRDTDEVSWPPTRMMDELKRLGLVDADHSTDGAALEGEARRVRR